jgi:hypothetical protein
MPRRLTFSDAATLCLQRADAEGDPHIDPAELAAMMSSSYGDAYSVVAKSGGRYFETTYQITATGADSYDEPDDHLSTIGMELVSTTKRRTPVHQLAIQHRHRWAGRTGQARRFVIIDDQIFLYPVPSSGTYELLYIPQAPDLKTFADGDLFDVVTPDGEEMFIWGTVKKILGKKGRSAVMAHDECEAARGRLLEWALLRSMVEGPVRVVQDDDDCDYADPNGSWNDASWRFR